jgi:hypothetical protein
MDVEQFAQLKQELLTLYEDLNLERLINKTKIANSPPGSYPYGEGMHDGLRYAAAGLEAILSRYNLLTPGQEG